MGIIFVSISLIGIEIGKMKTLRINDLREFKKAFLILKSEIESFKTPLGECCKNISLKTKEPVSQIFGAVHDEIYNFTQNNLDSVWVNKIEKYKSYLNLKNEDIEELKSFGNCFGFSDDNMQKKNIDFTISYIDDKIEILNQETEKNKKLFNNLGILSGILACILLM